MDQIEKQEIIKSFKEAKDKKAQIKILADLHVCTQKEIKDVLSEAGLDIPKRKYVKRTEVVTINGQPQKIRFSAPDENYIKQAAGGVPQIVRETLDKKIQEMETINSNYTAEIKRLEQAIKDNENSIREIKAYMKQEG